MHNSTSILPITGAGLKVARNGRKLLDIDRVELGNSGITAIIGDNGAGKSLFLKVLSGLQQPDEGIVLWNGRSISRERYSRFGHMTQSATLLRRTARANLVFPLMLTGTSKAEASQRADTALVDAGLDAISDTSARLLSGGERQRLSLARVLITKPEIVFLDEPTASLDPASKRAIEDRILLLKDEGVPVVLVTHSLAQARRLADDIIFFHRASILVRQAAIDFFSQPGCEEARRFMTE